MKTNEQILLRHRNGTLRLGFVRGTTENWMRVAWSPSGNEGVDIDLTTEQSPMGCWEIAS